MSLAKFAFDERQFYKHVVFHTEKYVAKCAERVSLSFYYCECSLMFGFSLQRICWAQHTS